MRDFRDAKTMGASLRKALAARGLQVTHSDSLELISHAFGFDNWNVLAAKIEAAKPAAQNPGDSEATLFCSFCGKSQHEVEKLIAGPNVFICDRCVGLCSGILGDEAITALLKLPFAEAFAALAGYPTEKLLAYREAMRKVIEANERGAEQHAQDARKRRRFEESIPRLNSALEALSAVLKARGAS